MTDSSDSMIDALFERLNAMPGGAYYAQMLRNNAEFMSAIRQIDPADPNATERALTVAFGALGIDSNAIAAMMAMIERLKRSGIDPNSSDPNEILRAMGADPSILGAMGAHAAPSFRPPAAAAAPVVDHPAPSETSAPSIRTQIAPAWENIAQEASRLIATGNERRGFELLTSALDGDAASEYDPSNFERYCGLTSLLEIMAAESMAAGRQVPLRFASLFQRYALFVGFAQSSPPSTNPEFTAWCAAIVEHATRR